MAVIYPEFLPSDTKSQAEMLLFERIKTMPGTDQWVVFYSVRIAEHFSQPCGEADFFIVAPRLGCFVIEVKGGQKIQEKDKIWTSVDRNGRIHAIKDPGKEAQGSMFSIKKYLTEKAKLNIQNVLFGFGAFFPETIFNNTQPLIELSKEQIGDAADIDDFPSYIRKLSTFWAKQCNKTDNLLSQEQCNQIVDALKPFVSSAPSENACISLGDETIDHLTDRQQEVFEGLLENDRVLVKGAAGTGKTLLAINYAKQMARQGKRVGFFCYNLFLASFLQKQVNNTSALVCDSFTEFMEKEIQRCSQTVVLEEKNTQKQQYYSDSLPDAFENCILQGEIPLFDCIVIDEAQDILTAKYLEVLDLLLDGGLNKGHWFFFLDQEKQNIFNTTDVLEASLSELKKVSCTFSLRENCRNSIAIIKEIDKIYGLDTKIFRRDFAGLTPQLITYSDKHEQTELIKKTLQNLMESGIEKKKITALTASSSLEKSALFPLFDDPELELTTLDNFKSNRIACGTIRKYKGLENSVIVLTDFDKLWDEHSRNLLYIGMTRSKSELIVFLSNSSIDQIKRGKLRSLKE